jgi:cytoskeleton protein RodZ
MTEAAAEFEAPDPAPTPGPSEPAAPQAQTAGAQLMRAREGAGLSRADVAGKLKFSVKQIETVESDNYAALGGPTFVRGLVRTYAKLLNADVAPILAALDSSELPPETGQVAADRKGIPFPASAHEANPVLRYLVMTLRVAAVAMLLLLLLYFWHGEELLSGPGIILPQTRQPAAAPVAPAAASSAMNLSPTVIDAPGAAQTSARATPPVAAERVTAVPAAVPPPKTEKAADNAPDRQPAKPVPAAAAGIGGSGRRIELSFDRNSWVEVKDTSGRILFSQLNLAGSQQTIEGRAPFDLVIGNAAYVQLRYRDASVDLKPYTKAEVARLTLN